MPQVNGQNVVKVGHRQVVNMIRQGGNTLMVKVVMVTRHPDMDEAVHKKGEPPRLRGQARLPPDRLSGALPAPGLPFLEAACPHGPSGEKLRQGGLLAAAGGESPSSGSAAVVAGGSRGFSPRRRGPTPTDRPSPF